MSRALYRTYRSKSLADVVGQKHITDLLAKAIKAGRISHAYLLTGPRGVGKTSVARILAHEINQLPYNEDTPHLDIIEIDAASNNGVEDVRELRERVQLAPVSASKKVYIIDEVHMLSKAAFNALLKTLEEPPAHVVFILATTDVEKLPATILSRTQRYSFRSIAENDAVAHLRTIADAEKIHIDDDSLRLIARRGDGSFRDSISLLDQLASLTDAKTGITTDLIEASLGLAPAQLIAEILEVTVKHDVVKLAELLRAADSQGIAPAILSAQITDELKDRCITEPTLMPLLDSLLDVPRSSQPRYKLLTVLGSFAAPEPKSHKTVALATPVLEVSATIAELSKKATHKKPKEPKATQSNSVSPPVSSDSLRSSSRVSQKEDSVCGGSDSDDTVEQAEFDWAALVDYSRKNFVALYSVLSKCTPNLENDELTLYTGNAFYKKKLDDVKYSAHLYDCLKQVGLSRLSIHTIPTGPPHSSSQVAAIADIMGGGEEVTVSDSAPAAA